MTSSFSRGAAILALVVACAAPSWAAKPRLTADQQQTVDGVLARVDSAQQQIRALRATVTETRQLALLNEPEVLRGELLFERPEKFRWNYLSPEKSSYVLADGQLTGWLPERNQVEKVDISRREKRLRRLVAIGQDSESLQRAFDITPGKQGSLDELVLVPSSRRVRKHLKRVVLAIDGEGLPRRVVYTTGNDDTVTLELTDLSINPDLPTNAFSLAIPADAKFVKGLSLGFMSSDGVAQR